ncbi:MAG: glycosyltransferase family 2 protein [Candidatus Parcubacteria bacterium]|nr:glycosyltransferase family 2 protein [Burkholderiales bacterium]
MTATAGLSLTTAPLPVDAASAARVCGWVLVDAYIGPQAPHSSATLSVRQRQHPDEVLDIALPITAAGRIHEQIRLPAGIAELCWQLPAGTAVPEPRLTMRRVGWLERVVRMSYRILWIRSSLPEETRKAEGLTLWRMLRDLPGVYRDATAFRARIPSQRYLDWIGYFDTLSENDLARIKADIARFSSRPQLHVVVIAGAASPLELQATLASLKGQLYGEFSSTVVGADEGEAACSRLNTSLARAGAGEWLMLLRAGDVLPAHALYWFACEALAWPEAAIFYADDDRVDAEGRRFDPRFKPDWSPVHFESSNYLGAAAIIRASAAAAAGGLTPDCARHGNFDLMLRVIDAGGDAVRHIPAVLLHRGADISEDAQWCAKALDAHFVRRGVAARIEATPAGGRRVRYALPGNPPLVSVIVPTRDALGLLRQCVESVLGRTRYPRYELLIVDNHSVEPATLAYLEETAVRPGVRVLRYRGRFNFSAINNIAAREAAGDMLCLLNNDTEVISPDWLEEMAGHLLQPRVGAVGAKLYYPNGRVQHAGVAVGPGGCAAHLHAGVLRGEAGYCGRAMLAQEYSAVTGACLLTWKRLWTESGGLNERWLPVAFNDIDYCLRLLEAGHRVVFTPHAELYHFESASRGHDMSHRNRLRAYRELKYMRMRWKHRMGADPYYNPNLSYRRPDFSLSERRGVARPWTEAA